MQNEKLAKISIASLERMPIYLSVFQSFKQNNCKNISSNAIATLTNINASLVKKDLSSVISKVGKPKLGYEIDSLIQDIESILKFKQLQKAIIVGVGKLGSALYNYEGFEEYGLKIVYGFDTNENLINKNTFEKKIYNLNKLKEITEKDNIKIGIITTPAEFAQKTADLLIESGIKAIWNFTSKNLKVPDEIVVKNENLATSLAILSKQLQTKIFKEE